MLEKGLRRIKRHNKIRTIVNGTKERPRAIVVKSNTRTYVQIVNDIEGKIIISTDTSNYKEKLKPLEICQLMGKKFGEQIIGLGINELVFDRNGYKYHGKVKAIATGLRESGLKF